MALRNLGGALVLALLALASCSEEERGVEVAPVECPGVLENARCLKACGLAVETTRTSGMSYQVQREDGQSQPMEQPDTRYTVASFLVTGPRLALDLPRPLLSSLHAGEVDFPFCLDLASLGGDAGRGQYMPSGQTFSTDDEYRGTVALLAYDQNSGALEGIFRFDAALEVAGGSGDGERWGTSIEQGYFRALPQN